MTEIVVCGFFKADGVDRALPLRRRLDGLRTRYDFVAIDICGSPDAYALSKPLQVGAAMDRHPGKTILFIDLACRIVGTRDDLLRAADIPGDIAFHVRTRLCSQGKPVLTPHAETLVLRPTARAHVFVRTWIETWERAAGIGSECDVLAIALARVPELAVTFLGAEFCATQQDAHPLPVIVHERADANLATAPGRIDRLMRWLLARDASL
jgi:hypothetical protein